MRLLLLLLLLVTPAFAQYEGYLTCTPKEQEAYSFLEKHKLVELREKARAIINEDPKSIPGHYMMGYSLHQSEGDLPRAHFHLEKAHKLYRARYGTQVKGAPWGWLEKTLEQLERVSGEMDLYEEQLVYLDQIQDLCVAIFGQRHPVYTAMYAWPLMKLGREQDARGKLMSVSGYNDEPTRTTYWNSKGALEMETDHARASYDAFQSLIKEIQTNGWNMACTYLRNGGEAAACVGRFDEAERLYLESTNYFDPMSYSNPWWDLANLYLSQGRFVEALSALQKTHKWSYDSVAFLGQQSWAANQQLTCELLLQLGLTEHALRIAETFVNRPDRKGGDSVQRDQWEAANLLIYREALRARRASLVEEMTWAKGWRWWQLLWEQRKLSTDAFLAGQKAAAIAVSHGRLAKSLRYSYAPGTVLIPNYYRPELVTVIGPGAVAAGLEELYESKLETINLEMPYFQSIEAEVEARSGNRAEALKLLEQCLQKLPPTEKLLRARCLARAAELEERSGHADKARAYYTQVMETAPGVMRMLELPLPVAIQGTEGNAVFKQAARMLRSSPRFRRDADGLIILFENKDPLKASLVTKDGSVLAEAEVKSSKDPDQMARDLVADIHWKFFAPRIDMTQFDINSLDGSNLTGKAQNQRLQDMFMPNASGPKT